MTNDQKISEHSTKKFNHQNNIFEKALKKLLKSSPCQSLDYRCQNVSIQGLRSNSFVLKDKMKIEL